MAGVNKLCVVDESTEEESESAENSEASPYDKLDLTKCSVKELKAFCADAKMELQGPFEKNELVEEAKKAIEILK
jgi:hypothetical protein